MPILVEPQLVTSDRKIMTAPPMIGPQAVPSPPSSAGQLQLDRLREAERRLRIDRHVELHVEDRGERGHRRAHA